MSRAEFPAGKYYIGDLCYAIPDSLWDDVCNLIIVDNQVLDGQFELHSHKFAIYSTAYGDGTYYDQLRNEYPVDSGSIGCISIDSLTALGFDDDLVMKIVNDELGQIVEFDKPFTCYSDDGTIRFGHIAIATGDLYDDDEDYKESDIW